MRDSLLDMLRCPDCGASSLAPRGRRGACDELIDGALACGACARTYPVCAGIPRLLPSNLACELTDATTDTVRKRSEMRARDDQAADYDRMWYLSLFGLVEVPVTLAMMSLERRHTLLEAGCGTGRMTREFATRCERLVCVDFSWESLARCARKLALAEVANVDLVQADITRLPFRDGRFDRVVSCQVLEHVPTPESRMSAVAELARATRDGGRTTVSAYQYNLCSRWFGQKEGEHRGGIYFYRFSRQELHDLLSLSLRVERMTGALLYHYIAACRKEDP
jgi:ubiquinone/menaquinone biosynthesis C-methylase UbiE/uncharacterized protein YbaR (Trm112 family)